jgi:hypothetical protein
MEINNFEEVYPAVASGAVVEGRMVFMLKQSNTWDFGSGSDLPGVKTPDTAEEAKRSNFIVTWPVSNLQLPMYLPVPAYTYALRQGFDQTTNLPITTSTIYTTYPGNQNSLTIPDGTPVLAFAEGTYTVPSGQYVYNVNLTYPGAPLEVANTAEDGAGSAGKLKYLSAVSDRMVAKTYRFDSTTGALTFTIRP